MRDQAHPTPTATTLDSWIASEARQPKLWLGAFLIALLAILTLTVVLLGGPLT